MFPASVLDMLNGPANPHVSYSAHEYHTEHNILCVVPVIAVSVVFQRI